VGDQYSVAETNRDVRKVFDVQQLHSIAVAFSQSVILSPNVPAVTKNRQSTGNRQTLNRMNAMSSAAAFSSP
jgi:hypothetical protein